MNLISKNMKAQKSLSALHGLQTAATSSPVQVVEIEESFYQLGPTSKVPQTRVCFHQSHTSSFISHLK